MGRDNLCIVAQRIRERRKCAAISMTQEELADKSGLSVKTINKIEHMAAPTLTVDTFIRLCKALKCSADYLLGIDPLPTHELSDIHALTDLSEDAIDSLMQRKVNAYKYGRSFETEDHLLVADLMSYLITHIDDNILVQFVRTSAESDIYKKSIADMKAYGYMNENATYKNNETVRNSDFLELSARNTKTEIAEEFKHALGEWIKGRLDEDVERLLAESDYYRK